MSSLQASAPALSSRAVALLRTIHPPGSPGKIRILHLRAGLRLPLFVAGDAILDEREALAPSYGGNGQRMGCALVHLHTADALAVVIDAALPPREPPQPPRASVLAGRLDPAWRAREAERKRRERARRKALGLRKHDRLD